MELLLLLAAVAVVVAFITALFKAPATKGYIGEASVKFTAKLRLPEDIYHPLHDITLPTPDGTTQIDHIFVSVFGIFVVETKNMKGWIFGSEKQDQWTQTLYKKSFKFQNPLRQNYKHVKALEAVLDVPPNTIHSVIAFVGDSTFKSMLPSNVTQGGGYATYIRSFLNPVLSEAQVQAALSQIEAARYDSTFETHLQHIQNLESRSDPYAERQCPRCGRNMILRTAKKGKNVGKQFWGCSGYPTCKVVQNIT